MKKSLNTSILQNELQSGSAFFHHPTTPEKTRKSTTTINQSSRRKKSTKKGDHGNRPKQSPKIVDKDSRSEQSIETIDQGKQLKQSPKTVDQSNRLSQSTTSTDQLNRLGQLVGPVKQGSPPAFYLPEVISDKIDAAVKYYQEKCQMRQVDRTAIVAAILGDPTIWTSEALDKLAEKVMEQFSDRKRRMLEARLS